MQYVTQVSSGVHAIIKVILIKQKQRQRLTYPPKYYLVELVENVNEGSIFINKILIWVLNLFTDVQWGVK